MYKLSNAERRYFGLEPIGANWDEVYLKAGAYAPESLLYFEDDVLKRQIVTTDTSYIENQYDELTLHRKILLPKTSRGKEKKITAAVLEQRQPYGIYLRVSNGELQIGNYNTQTTFYSTDWDNESPSVKSVPEQIADFIRDSPKTHIEEINNFKNEKRKKVKFKSGDYFRFKISRNSYGFGQVLFDINKIRKKKLISESHGWQLLMGIPVIIQLFAYTSTSKDIDLATLDSKPKLPACVIMDNLLFYGEYEIFGHKDIPDYDYSFPISYGQNIRHKSTVFLQWGLIHKEIPCKVFDKYIYEKSYALNFNPYAYYGIGYRPNYNTLDIIKTVENKVFDFDKSNHFSAKTDLRNPSNQRIRDEIFRVFRLDPTKGYYENSLATHTILPSQINKLIK